jgi:uncharacterized protein YaeQ
VKPQDWQFYLKRKVPVVNADEPFPGAPVVMLIVRLLAAASMTDDRIAFTSGASPQDDFGAARGPIGSARVTQMCIV